MTEEEMRCAECTCANGGAECNWIAPPREDDRKYTQSQLDEAVRAAVEAERAECAKVADIAYPISDWLDRDHAGRAIAAAIRARGETCQKP